MTLGASAPSPSQPRAAAPGGGGVPLEDAAAKLSLGKDPIEKEGGEILDDILGGGGGGEARWPEDLSTASDQQHDAKRKGPHLSKSSAPPILSRAEAALDSTSDLHEALLLLPILTVSQAKHAFPMEGEAGLPITHQQLQPVRSIFVIQRREKLALECDLFPSLGLVKVPNSPLGLDLVNDEPKSSLAFSQGKS